MDDSTHAALAKRCKVMRRLIADHGPCPYKPHRRSPFEAVSRAIVYQQLSGKAAGTIYARVAALFDAKVVKDPKAVLARSDDELRGAGLSRNKTAALKDLARKTLDGVVPTRRACDTLDDEDLIDRLVAVRGVGRWTAEMFLMSTLARPDVLAVDDLGLRKGAGLAYGLAEAPSPKELLEIGEAWRPWRTTASWYLWRAADTRTP